MLYANDGAASVSCLKRRKRVPVILVWYDSFENVVERPPSRREWVDFLRYRNVIDADAVLAVSDTLVGMAKTLRSESNSVFYMPTGVDTAYFDPTHWDPSPVRRRYGIPDGDIVVGYIGRIGLGSHGNFAGLPLVEAAAKVAAAPEGERVKYLVVGFGDGLPVFKRRVEALRLTDRFRFTGYVPHDEVPGHLAAVDICVDTLDDLFLSYARNETKMKEYLSMGKAIVATGIGENVKDLDHGRAGMLAESSPSSITECLLRLAGDAGLRERLGRAARARAESVYDWSVVARVLQRVLGDIHGRVVNRRFMGHRVPR